MLTADTILQNRYLVVRPLGHGGMGAVYEAIDQRLGARVALKETLVAGESLLRAFEREARLLSGLRHQALPVVMDYFVEGDGRFLVMQYIPGDDLGALLVRGGRPFPVETVLRWGVQVLDSGFTQSALTVVWTLIGVSAWSLGSRRANRPLWMAGAGLMPIEMANLLQVDRH